MTILCANVGTQYASGDYTGKLYRGLSRNTQHAFNFQCITESPYPGWWAYIAGLPVKERTVVIDVDMVICGNIDFLFAYDGPFCIRRNPWAGAWCDACLMSLSRDASEIIHAAFTKDPQGIMRQYRSDQELIADLFSPDSDTWQDFAPGKTASYKADSLEDGPRGASIITFHGEPKPHQVGHAWVKEHWQ